MRTAVIKTPIINSPFKEPNRHYHLDQQGITDRIVEDRRISSYFSPIPEARSRRQALVLPEFEEEVRERIEENTFINELRGLVASWRNANKPYDGVTPMTRMLLNYWQNEERVRHLFFAQIEALETVIFLTEVAPRVPAYRLVLETLKRANLSSSANLNRVAFKLCTGAGKTVVMGMLIAWHALNKQADPQNKTYAEAFLLVAPGITIRDRLRVLLPSDPNNYYDLLDLVPNTLRENLNRAKITIVNYHAFKRRDTADAAKLTKDLLATNGESPFLETSGQMVRRVCRELGNKKNIIVINDEAHHCWTRKPDTDETAALKELKGDDKKDAQKEAKAAHLWHTGLEQIQAAIGIRQVYDLSATPFYLRGSGYSEGTLFPWVVSDFSLIDGIEAGIVKVPRVPISDDAMSSEGPKYRNLWKNVQSGLPKAGRSKAEPSDGMINLPAELEGAITSLYDNYAKYYARWEASAAAQLASTAPVFIVVCQNTQISKLVYDYISGYERTLPDGTTRLVPGKLPLFSNVSEDGNLWRHRPFSILVDSEQLESGEALSDDFKKIAAVEIAEYKREYRLRYPGRDGDDLTDADILREVMNTVGKRGKLGEAVRCVVSVSMLTEGWDANTVTHVLGVRAFGTQLLCEQVVGRALRRVSYEPNEEGFFDTEYAEVFGVPFQFIPCSGMPKDPKPGVIPMRVRAIEERRATCEIRFPRVVGYRFELPTERLTASFQQEHHLSLTPQDVPVNTENAPIIGESVMISIEGLKQKREQEVDYLLAHLVLTHYFSDSDGYEKPWLFPQLRGIARQWRQICLHCASGSYPQMVLMTQIAHRAAERIYRAVVSGSAGQQRLLPILRPYEFVGTTRFVDFYTTRPTYLTDADKCHITHVVADTDSWEQKMAQVLEEMDEVARYVKNHNLGFSIPYTLDGVTHQYYPDFIALMDDGGGKNDPLQLIVEVTGLRKKDKEAKADTAKTLWVPAVNAHGGFGRWSYIEIVDPWDDADKLIRSIVSNNPFAAWFAPDGKTSLYPYED